MIGSNDTSRISRPVEGAVTWSADVLFSGLQNLVAHEEPAIGITLCDIAIKSISFINI